MDYYIRKSDEVASHQRNVEIRPLSSYFPFLPIYTLNFLLSEVAKNQKVRRIFFLSSVFIWKKSSKWIVRKSTVEKFQIHKSKR